MINFRRIITIIFSILVMGFLNISYAETFTDSLAREVRLNRKPLRIVPLAPSLTEMLYFLGLGDRVVGVTQFSNYPPEATNKPRVGSYNKLNVEKIISLNPDLVIGTVDGNEAGVVKLLEEAGIPVYIVNPRNVRDVISTIAAIGKICGVREKAREMSSRLKRRVDHVVEKTASLKRPLVFLQINITPIMTVNKNTFHHDVIRLAGGENMAQDDPATYPRICLEEVLRRNPEIIVISSMERGGRFERARKEWLKWKDLEAVKHGRIYLIDSDLLDRPSPRIVKGLEAMARVIHPEVGWGVESLK